MAFSEFITAQKEVPAGFSGSVGWRSPSNIALVKYWGKKGDQLPSNASLSFTLSESVTETRLTYQERAGAASTVDLRFEGKPASPGFAEKSVKFLEKIRPYVPWLEHLDLQIDTQNSFPHSSGIASSASGMSALALCLISIEAQLTGQQPEALLQKASFLARIGSGSASRSVYGGAVMWGEHDAFAEASDLYAIPAPFPMHEVFGTYRDTILLVDKGQKKVSSTVGHGLLKDHPFAEERFRVAQSNIQGLQSILESGDLEAFTELVEAEALMLHALMMTSTPGYLLMRPDTLAVLEKIRAFRSETGIPVCFTLDAGANVHVLYPEAEQQNVLQLVMQELVTHCENKSYLRDVVGNGPQALTP